MLTLRLAHKSRQKEAGSERDVVCEVEARVVGAVAHQMNALPAGVIVRIEGFIAVRNARSNIPVLHVRTFELLEGNQNGI